MLPIALLAGTSLFVEALVPTHRQATQRLGTQGHSLVTLPDGEPFFWAADTAWNLLVKANVSEAAEYFAHRRAQGFNVVQVTATGFNGDGHGHDHGGAGYGQSMLARNGVYPWLQSDLSPVPPPGTMGLDPTKPNPVFWTHIDSILDVATEHGFQVALWPAWGSCFVSKGGCSWDTPLHSIFNTSDAGWRWGRFIGQRYGRRPNVLYVLGGDIAEPVSPEQRKAVYRAMAEGIAQGVADSLQGTIPSRRPAWNNRTDPLWGNQLISLHPGGKLSSSGAFGGEPWLSFNMIQSGFGRQSYIVPLIQRDYTSYHVPTIMGEGAYERSTGYTWCGQGPIGNRSTRGVTHPWGVRLNAWWSVLGGGFGFSYGSEGTWEWRNNLTKFTDPKGYALYTWREAVFGFPGAGQLAHLSKLGTTHLWGLKPDLNGSIVRGQAKGSAQNCTLVVAAHTRAGGVVAYSSVGSPIAFSPTAYNPSSQHAEWLDPRTGLRSPAVPRKQAADAHVGEGWLFSCPSSGVNNDWVLLVG